MICTQSSWHPPTKKLINETSFCMLLKCTQKKTIPRSFLNLRTPAPVAFNSSFVHPRFQFLDRTLLLNELYITCTSIILGDFSYPVMCSIRLHRIENTMSIAQFSFSSSIHRTHQSRKNPSAAVQTSNAKSTFELQAMTSFVPPPQAPSLQLVELSLSSY